MRGFFIGSIISVGLLELRIYRFYAVSTNMEQKIHAYTQMQLVFHPHQVAAIEKGAIITDTMPVGSGEAVAISFDTIASTRIDHPEFKHALEQVMSRSHGEMMAGYSMSPLESSAFLAKNMGDGFFASVGFPFAVPRGRPKEEVALELAEKFAAIFCEEMGRLNYREPIRCAIGLAAGTVEGYFPTTGVKAYDLRDGVHEKTLALAKRHESLIRIVRKFDSSVMDQSMVMLQEKVWLALPEISREKFQA